ncbi:hypothetical protein DPW03_07170 [Aggregatibacter aphrophilus]|nr:hypothetical protein DPW03_07170 [Aggregatibacter aphrophilus]RDE97392.1 hypothetical protein DPW02_05940 [Aggregatibacter aphrophilus]RDF02203.1 hypothetical protein DPV99_05635 [Aggregatibacter aphrophilus]
MHPDKPLFFALLQFSLRKFSNSLRSNRRKFPKNCKSLRCLIRDPILFERCRKCGQVFSCF